MVGVAVGTYIAATHANVCNTDEHIMGVCQFWDLFIFEFRVFCTVEYYGRIPHIDDITKCNVRGVTG